MRNRRNYYRILHVQPEAPTAILRSSYRALMLQLEAHPDRGGDPELAALINEAYAVLSDPERRRAYDEELASRTSSPRRARQPDDRAAASVRPAPAEQEKKRSSTPREPCAFCQSTAGDGQRCAVCRSPLALAGQDDLAECGQRAARRLPHERRVRLYTEWPQPRPLSATLRDISPRGLRLDVAQRLPRHVMVKIDAGPLQATGRVAYCKRLPGSATGGWTIGIELRTLLVEPGSLVSRSG